MKTRIELWKNYRKEIRSSIELQKAVSLSNEKLKLLNKRLLEVFPNYNEKYKFDFKTIEPVFSNEIIHKKYFLTKEIDDLMQTFEDFDLNSKSFQAINKIDFSSHDLNNIIADIQDHNYQGNYEENEDFEKSHQNLRSKKIQVAIDGPSGSGKSTLARAIAKKYNLKYVNTGLFYRAIALNAILKNINLENEQQVFRTLIDGMIQLKANEQIFLWNQNVTSKLLTNEISQGASKVSAHLKVRNWAVKIQKQYANESRVAMDGRDTTFNIMPNANIKIFLETSIDERVKRRLKENQEKGFKDSFEVVLKEIKERDYRDKNRKFNPLHKVKDAHLIDATDLSINAVVAKASQLIERELKNE